MALREDGENRGSSEGRQTKGIERVEDGVDGRQTEGVEAMEDVVQSRQAKVSEKMEDGGERRQARENKKIDEVEGCQATRSEEVESKADKQGDRDELDWLGRVMEEVQKKPMGWARARQ